MELINLLLSNAVALILGLGGAVIFYRSRRRKESAEATGAELQTQGALVNQYETFIDTITQREKELRVELTEARKHEAIERERVVVAYKECSEVRVELEILRGKYALAEWRKCDVSYCKSRKPPRTELPTEN